MFRRPSGEGKLKQIIATFANSFWIVGLNVRWSTVKWKTIAMFWCAVLSDRICRRFRGSCCFLHQNTSFCDYVTQWILFGFTRRGLSCLLNQDAVCLEMISPQKTSKYTAVVFRNSKSQLFRWLHLLCTESPRRWKRADEIDWIPRHGWGSRSCPSSPEDNHHPCCILDGRTSRAEK